MSSFHFVEFIGPMPIGIDELCTRCNRLDSDSSLDATGKFLMLVNFNKLPTISELVRMFPEASEVKYLNGTKKVILVTW
ncbi:MAG: hypothetical protein U0O04_06775 [Clostridia bacterium]